VRLERLASRETTIAAFIKRLEHLEQRIAELTDDKRKLVTDGVVSPAHSAKGLEFDTVIVCDAVEGTFPSSRCTDGIDALAEERRIFFVAMTRARNHLVLMRRLERGSPFIEEVGGYLGVTLT
jgi:DNA helicase-2/ATP-dependent DNA helicase PcrA